MTSLFCRANFIEFFYYKKKKSIYTAVNWNKIISNFFVIKIYIFPMLGVINE